jgi:hypothetical protein
LGTVRSPQTFVRIRWEYIGLLATQIALTSCFLAAVVIVTTTSGTQPLKGSSIMTMTALSDDTRRQLVEKRDPAESLTERAERVEVRLEKEGEGQLRLSMPRSKSRQSFQSVILGEREADLTRWNGRHADVGAWI